MEILILKLKFFGIRCTPCIYVPGAGNKFSYKWLHIWEWCTDYADTPGSGNIFQRRIKLREVKNRRGVSATASSGSNSSFSYLPPPPQNLGRDRSRTFQIQRFPLTLILIISPIPRSRRSEQRWVRFFSPRNLSSHQSRNRSSCWIWESI